MMKFIQVPIVTNIDEAKHRIETERKPFILRNFDFGPCLNKWTVDYLKGIVQDKPVRIHVSKVTNMDFVKKNFSYNTLPFNELIKRASEETHDAYFVDQNEKYYLRSLGADERKDVADIKKEYPELAKDIQYPPFFDDDKFFSSVFRISSSNLRLWTHYDMMDNVLIQVKGQKRVILFPPSEVDNLYMTGDKSLVTDVDSPDLEKFPLFAKAVRYECELTPGDGIFIPALWLHNVITLEFSIGVNVFWKHLDEKFYEKKDIYGNKDLVVAKKALEFIDKAIKELNLLPYEYKEFYTKRIILALNENLNKN